MKEIGKGEMFYPMNRGEDLEIRSRVKNMDPFAVKGVGAYLRFCLGCSERESGISHEVSMVGAEPVDQAATRFRTA